MALAMLVRSPQAGTVSPSVASPPFSAAEAHPSPAASRAFQALFPQLRICRRAFQLYFLQPRISRRAFQDAFRSRGLLAARSGTPPSAVDLPPRVRKGNPQA
jgi:hypothetical protein